MSNITAYFDNLVGVRAKPAAAGQPSQQQRASDRAARQAERVRVASDANSTSTDGGSCGCKVTCETSPPTEQPENVCIRPITVLRGGSLLKSKVPRTINVPKGVVASALMRAFSKTPAQPPIETGVIASGTCSIVLAADQDSSDSLLLTGIDVMVSGNDDTNNAPITLHLEFFGENGEEISMECVVLPSSEQMITRIQFVKVVQDAIPMPINAELTNARPGPSAMSGSMTTGGTFPFNAPAEGVDGTYTLNGTAHFNGSITVTPTERDLTLTATGPNGWSVTVVGLTAVGPEGLSNDEALLGASASNILSNLRRSLR